MIEGASNAKRLERRIPDMPVRAAASVIATGIAILLVSFSSTCSPSGGARAVVDARIPRLAGASVVSWQAPGNCEEKRKLSLIGL
jgi:hypothetical protein